MQFFDFNSIFLSLSIHIALNDDSLLHNSLRQRKSALTSAQICGESLLEFEKVERAGMFPADFRRFFSQIDADFFALPIKLTYYLQLTTYHSLLLKP
jgi:hypothetical protein